MSSSQNVILEPRGFAQRVMLAVTGLSPQIVTETLYALTQTRSPSFLPTEIHLVTTQEGAERARLMLLDPDDGHFHQFCREYGLGASQIKFDESCIHVVHDASGKPLMDITTESDNAAVADTITEQVRLLTADSDSAVHASIAGGRKTMGFYLGYALSLYGRAQDRLSHVLVSSPFESDHQFYYPPAKPKTLIIKDRPVRTSDAQVMLADIPFVRLRDELPSRLLEAPATFSELVVAAQMPKKHPRVELNLHANTVQFGDEIVTMSNADLAFFSWFARRALEGKPPLRWSAPGVAEEFLSEYARITGEMAGDYEVAEKALKDGMTSNYFTSRKGKTNGALRDALGERASRPFHIVSDGARNESRCCLVLPAGAITYSAIGGLGTRAKMKDL